MTSITCLHAQMDPYYIVAGAMAAWIGTWLAVGIKSRASQTSGDRKSLMLCAAGFCLGASAWTAHCIWILGTNLPFLHAYNPPGIALSLLLSISTACLGMYLAATRDDVLMKVASSIVLGSGFTLMHFVGLLAHRFNGTITFDIQTVLLTVACGSILVGVALNWPLVISTKHPKAITTTVLTIAVGTLHYVGTAGLELNPTSDLIPFGLDDRDIVMSVVLMSVMTMAAASFAFAVDTQKAGEKLRDMEHRAFHDNLTGLPNRALLEDTLAIITTMVSSPNKLVIVNFDLNRFKSINDVHGHAAGDQVLISVASALRNALLGGEFVCRVGGDEFIAFKRQVSDEGQVTEFTERLRTAITKEIDWNGKSLAVGTSMGVSLYPDHGTDIRELLSKADLAMYRAKRDRAADALLYNSAIDDENLDKSALSIDLRSAVSNNELDLVYQKQNSIKDGRLVGFEVLARWRHPTKGPVGPDVFIPLAERDGVIDEIGEWVIRTACMHASGWIKPMKIAVNVAARQLANNDFPKIVREALEKSGLESKYLEIEITESGIIADAEQALKIVREIKRMGVSIVMDDFGTGYSSLSTLQSFPFDKIKIDKAFIKDIVDSRQSQAIVKSTIVLANALEIAVLAEGVETEEELAFLRKEGCSHAQGFLFGEPLPHDQVEAA